MGIASKRPRAWDLTGDRCNVGMMEKNEIPLMPLGRASSVPTIVVILGATGDLSRKKLIPSLFDLYIRKHLPEGFRIIGFSRGMLSDEDFRNFMHKSIDAQSVDHKQRDMDDFLGHAFYLQGDFDDLNAYGKLSGSFLAADKDFGRCSNKLLYLAVPPKYYESIFQNLASAYLSSPCSDETGWTRVLVEKPFGRDIDTARSLDRMLGHLFREEQIFRIDHYLARETLQNILTFRFSNTIFEPVWNNNYIEKIEIRLLEKIGVEMRGAFYEDIGALRDVGQNHLLQMLAIITMDHPGPLGVDSIRRERAKIISSLIPPPVNAIKDSVVRGQYIGFTGEKDVHADSATETYFRIKAYLDNDRWRGVPFYLESGKALKEKKTEIAVYFKEIEPCFCPGSHKERRHQNIFTFKIQPDEGISIRFWARQPGLGEEIETRDFAFNYGEGSKLRTDAYERVLYDCIQGDQTLFVSTDEVTAAWEYITSILNNWVRTELHKYQKGSGGPEVSLE